MPNSSWQNRHDDQIKEESDGHEERGFIWKLQYFWDKMDGWMGDEAARARTNGIQSSVGFICFRWPKLLQYQRNI